jgi:hypothetical protein
MASALPDDTNWINTKAQLPARGQPVEFMLAARECPIVGVYSDGGFRSRWTNYAPEIVCRWRGALGDDRNASSLEGNRAA